MKVYVESSPQHGRGVFATRADRRRRGNPAVRRAAGAARAELQPDEYHLQIGDDLYLGASGRGR
ncbi:MAG: hypothetical protein MZW92_29090 [Comamonadaceae bacterium]|nr:hypothetical protein [Comamonadaceae bacterium]